MLVSQSCPTLCSPTDCRLLCSWNSPGKITGVGSHSLLQRNFPTQGLNPGLLHCRQILYCLSCREVLPLYYRTHQQSLDASHTCHALTFLPLFFFPLLHTQQLGWGWLVLSSFFLNGKSQVPIHNKPFYCLGSNLII